jgi:integrase
MSTGTPASRRHYAQLISRVLKLAVYPCRLIEQSPLPAGFLPKTGKSPTYPFLHPGEEAQLASCVDVPLNDRVLFGVLAREGMRTGEARQLRWRDINLDAGSLSLDANKTNDPRAWAMDPGTRETLRAWKQFLGNAGDDDLVFVTQEGKQYPQDCFASLLRTSLKTAGVTRPELFEDGVNTKRIRAHDLRGTFVTLALANGKTETWVADRTGHRSSQMINRYRRQARTAEELGLGWFKPMHMTIPELADWARNGHNGSDEEVASEDNLSKSLARPAGFEPATSGLEIHRSIP